MRSESAFTLIELLVVITIIGILAGIALPAYTSVQEKAAQTKTLAQAKQIGLTLKLYAGDNDGVFPSKQLDPNTGQPGTADVTNSNEAFRQVFPQYLTQEKIFWVGKSKWCKPTAPDENISSTTQILAAGENHFAYVAGLTDTSPASWPLVADGFAGGTGSQADATYSKDPSATGGVWKGLKAIIVRVDQSGEIVNLGKEGTNLAFKATRPNPTGSGTLNLFAKGTSSNDTWLSGATVLNPLQP
ncbi:MAG: type II secretion system protein [Verrucomicrobia bacterium]|nr:type II secretion system protein [Verrucomicrobiota bacterium]